MELKPRKSMQKVWRTGRLPPQKVTTRDLGVDTQWAVWRCPSQKFGITGYHKSERIVKSLYSVGLYGSYYGAELGDMSVARMNDVRVSARKARGKGANLRRSSPLDLMAYGGPAEDPQVTADLNTNRVWQRKLNTGALVWPLDESVWETALNKGRGRGPIRHLKTLANRDGWVPHQQGWQCGEQVFTWQAADWKIKQDSSRALLAEVTSKRPDFAGLKPA
eukprot:2960634-Amphidinium_carterae.2